MLESVLSRRRWGCGIPPRTATLPRAAARRVAFSCGSALTALATTRAQLAMERTARVKAEQRASAALASLQQIANVKEEARGMVITLEGAVLLVTGAQKRCATTW